VNPPEPLLHASLNGRALCGAGELSKTLDASSPECSSMPLCEICYLLEEHQRREKRRAV